MTPIARVPLFAELPVHEIETLAASLRQHNYRAGTLLFREGDYGERFYIVLDGRIAIIKALDTADERIVAERGSGEFVGEMSLLNGDGLRTASARVQIDANVLELTRADFDALLHRHPTLAYQMLRVLSDRLRTSHDDSIRQLHERNERLAEAYAELKAAQARLIEQETLARELRLAREIQESMLPRQLPRLPGTDFGARMVAARMVGGDFYDLISLDANRVGVVIGDVAGKGVPAALFMALTCSLLRAEATRTPAPSDVLLRVNQQLLGMNNNSMFVTVLYGILDRATGTFSYARAGHDLPMIHDRNGRQISVGRERGFPLGLFAAPALDTQIVVVPEGGSLLLYTDGVTEATDGVGEYFGVAQLQAMLARLPDTSAQHLCDTLLDLLVEFQAGTPQADDITVVAVRLCREDT